MGGLNVGFLGLAPKKWNAKAKEFFLGNAPERENVSTLRPEQEKTYRNLQDAARKKGAPGVYGDVADYHRSNLSDNPADFDKFAAPALRQYNEDIMPGISEQFAGMGAGGLSSSGFQNAQIQGATDLSERLGAMRAELRQRSAEGLQGIGDRALQQYSQNMETRPGSEGVLPGLVKQLPGIAASYFTGGAVPPAAVNSSINNAKSIPGISASSPPNVGQNPSGNKSWLSMSGNRTGANLNPYGIGR